MKWHQGRLAVTVAIEPTALSLACVPEFWAAHVKPSPLVRMVPPSPTAAQVPALVYEMPYKLLDVGTLVAIVQVIASLLVTMAPLSPTATAKLVLAATAFKF